MIYFAGKKSSPKPGFKSKQQPFSSACSAGTKPKIFPVSKTTALNKKPQTLSESNREHQVQQQQQQPQQHQHTVRFFARFVLLFTFFYIFFTFSWIVQKHIGQCGPANYENLDKGLSFLHVLSNSWAFDPSSL